MNMTFEANTETMKLGPQWYQQMQLNISNDPLFLSSSTVTPLSSKLANHRSNNSARLSNSCRDQYTIEILLDIWNLTKEPPHEVTLNCPDILDQSVDKKRPILMKDFILQKSVQQAMSNANKRLQNYSERSEEANVYSTNADKPASNAPILTPTAVNSLPITTAYSRGTNKNVLPSPTVSSTTAPVLLRTGLTTKQSSRVKSGDSLTLEAIDHPHPHDYGSEEVPWQLYGDITNAVMGGAAAGTGGEFAQNYSNSRQPSNATYHQNKGRGRIITRGGVSRGATAGGGSANNNAQSSGWRPRAPNTHSHSSQVGGGAGSTEHQSREQPAGGSDSDSGGEWQQVGGSNARQQQQHFIGGHVAEYGQVNTSTSHPPHNHGAPPGAAVDGAYQQPHSHWRQRTKSGGSERHQQQQQNPPSAAVGGNVPVQRRGASSLAPHQLGPPPATLHRAHNRNRNYSGSGGDDGGLGAFPSTVRQTGNPHTPHGRPPGHTSSGSTLPGQQPRRSRRTSSSQDQLHAEQEEGEDEVEPDIRPSSIGIDLATFSDSFLRDGDGGGCATAPVTLNRSVSHSAAAAPSLSSIDVDKLTFSLQQLASTTDGVEVLEEVLKKLSSVFPSIQQQQSQQSQQSGLTPNSDGSDLFCSFEQLPTPSTAGAVGPGLSTIITTTCSAGTPAGPGNESADRSTVHDTASDHLPFSSAMGPGSAQQQERLNQLAPPSMLVEQPKWFYIDPKGNIHGPYENAEMRHWTESGFFTDSLQLRRNCDPCFVPLSTYKQLYHNNSYFVDAVSHPPPLLPSMSSMPGYHRLPDYPAPVHLGMPSSPLHHHQHHHQQHQQRHQQHLGADLNFCLAQMQPRASRLTDLLVDSDSANDRSLSSLLGDSAVVGGLLSSGLPVLPERADDSPLLSQPVTQPLPGSVWEVDSLPSQIECETAAGSLWSADPLAGVAQSPQLQSHPPQSVWAPAASSSHGSTAQESSANCAPLTVVGAEKSKKARQQTENRANKAALSKPATQPRAEARVAHQVVQEPAPLPIPASALVVAPLATLDLPAAIHLPQHARWAESVRDSVAPLSQQQQSLRQLQELELRQQQEIDMVAAATARIASTSGATPAWNTVGRAQFAAAPTLLDIQSEQSVRAPPCEPAGDGVPANASPAPVWSGVSAPQRSLQEIQAEQSRSTRPATAAPTPPTAFLSGANSLWASKARVGPGKSNGPAPASLQPQPPPLAQTATPPQRSVLSIWSGAGTGKSTVLPAAKTPSTANSGTSASAANTGNKSKKQQRQQQQMASPHNNADAGDNATAMPQSSKDLDHLKHVMARHQPVNPLVQWAKETVQQLPAANSGSFDIATLIEIASDLAEKEEVFEIFSQYLGDSPASRSFTSEFLERRTGLQHQQQQQQATGAGSGIASDLGTKSQGSVRVAVTADPGSGTSLADKSLKPSTQNDLNWQTASKSGQSSRKKKKPQKSQILKF